MILHSLHRWFILSVKRQQEAFGFFNEADKFLLRCSLIMNPLFMQKQNLSSNQKSITNVKKID